MDLLRAGCTAGSAIVFVSKVLTCVRVRVRVRGGACRGGGAGHVTLERAGHVTLERAGHVTLEKELE